MIDTFDRLADAGGPLAPVRRARRALLEHDVAVGSSDAPTVAVVADADESVVGVFDLAIGREVVRVGPVTSLGTWLEYLETVPVQCVVTTTPDGLALHEFRPTANGSGFETLVEAATAEVISAARLRRPDLTTVVAPEDRHHDLGSRFAAAVGAMGLHLRAPAEVDELADTLVRLAADVRARRVVEALEQFTDAGRLGTTAAGDDAVEALRRGDVASLLVHDDPDDDRSDSGVRLVDDAVHLALVADVPVTMIPDAADGTGPAGNVGVVLAR